MKTFKQLFAEGANSDTKNDGAEYKVFFAAALKKFGVSSPSELKGEDEKKFYDYIDANWEADDEQPESMSSYGKKKKMKEDEQDEELSMYQKYVKGKKKESMSSYGKDKKKKMTDEEMSGKKKMKMKEDEQDESMSSYGKKKKKLMSSYGKMKKMKDEEMSGKKKVAPPGFHYMDNGELMADDEMKKKESMSGKKKVAPPGFHYMDNGKLMADDEMNNKESMSSYGKKKKMKDEDVEEAMNGSQASWVVTVKQNHNGLKVKDSVEVVARGTTEALKKAAKKLGVPDAWKHTGVLDVKKA